MNSAKNNHVPKIKAIFLLIFISSYFIPKAVKYFKPEI